MRKPWIALAAAALLASLWLLARNPQEKQPLSDAQTIDAFAEGAQRELGDAFPPGPHQWVPRDAHPKAHGCIKATFQVDPGLPDALRVATFSRPGESFKAWIRFSNGSATPEPDKKPDFRGMAIKLIDADPARSDSTRGRAENDILLVNFPVFFLAGLDDLRGLMRAGAFRADSASLRPYFFPSLNPFSWRLREFAIALRTGIQKVDSPLRVDYFSMTPYAFGSGRAIKYAARPCSDLAAPSPSDSPDFLRQALHDELKSGPACFELFAQVRAGDPPPDDLPLDDATREWPQAQAPLQRLGRLRLPAQDTAAAGRDAICENMSFNPAHAPEELAPLGGINRARAAVYQRIATYRMGRNGVSPTDAEQAWDSF